MNSQKVKVIEDNLKKVKALLDDVTTIENFICELEKKKYISITDGHKYLGTCCNLYDLLGKDVVEILKEKLQRMRNIIGSINENNLSNENLF